LTGFCERSVGDQDALSFVATAGFNNFVGELKVNSFGTELNAPSGRGGWWWSGGVTTVNTTLKVLLRAFKFAFRSVLRTSHIDQICRVSADMGQERFSASAVAARRSQRRV